MNNSITEKDIDLLLAADAQDTNRVKALLADGANPNTTTDNGITVLMGEAYNGHSDIVRLLLDADVTVDAKDENGLTALVYAMCGGHIDIMNLLKNAGADFSIFFKIRNPCSLINTRTVIQYTVPFNMP